MRFYHATTRRNCPGIATEGLRICPIGGHGVSGVWASYEVWVGGATAPLAEAVEMLGEDDVVLAFDVPEDVAGDCEVVHLGPLSPGDPGYDPAIDDQEPILPTYREWAFPEGALDRYFVGVVYPVADAPFTGVELAQMFARTVSPAFAGE